MMREFGSENRISLAPAANSSEPAEAACPVHSVDTGGRMNCIVSYIASPDVTTPQFIRPPVSTLCTGQAASAGSLLLAAGAKDMRFSLPNSRIMVHQPSGGFQGQATDILLHAQEIQNIKRRLNEIYVKHT